MRSDGVTRPVVASVRRSGDGASGRPLLHWELLELGVKIDDTPDRAVLAVQRIAQAAEVLSAQGTRSLTLDHVAEQALRAVPNADTVGITVMRHKQIETPAATGPLAATADRLQEQVGEGPCLQALHTGEVVQVHDMSTESRWPAFSPHAATMGVGSMLVLPLVAARGVAGALNLYSRDAQAFDEEDELIGRAYATHAGIALAHIDLELNLRTGLETRQEIGQAVGILMERHKLSAPTAFELLVQASQQAHAKLRDVASRVVATGQDPTEI